MMRKVLVMGGLVGAALLINSQRKDLARYLKIKQMSFGDGHPENVPVSGTQRYPAARQDALDETDDCVSA